MKSFRFVSLLAIAVGMMISSIASAIDRTVNSIFASVISHTQKGGRFYNARVMFTRAWETLYAMPIVSYALGSVAPVSQWGAGDMPTPQTFANYRVTNPNASEVVGQPLYDWQLYPQAGQQQFTFFSLPIGQGVTSTPGAVVGTAKTESDTNMVQGGSLPSGMEFLAESCEVYFQPGSVSTANTFTPVGFTTSATAALLAANISDANDMYQVYNEGTLKMKVLQKIQFTETPLRRFPPANWLEVDSSLATTNATTALAISTARPKGDLYQMKPPISLQSVVNFNVTIEYPAARALPSGFNGRIGVVLNGYTLRASQ